MTIPLHQRRPGDVKLWPDGIETKVFINSINKAPHANDSDNDDIANEESRADNERQPSEPKKERKKDYALDALVGHKRTKDGISCRMR